MPLGRLVGSALGIDRNLRLGGRVGFDLVDLRLLRALAAEVVFDLFVVRAYIGVELLAFLVGHALDVHPLVLLPASLILRLDLRAEQGFPDTQEAFFRSAVSRLRLLLPLGFLLAAEMEVQPPFVGVDLDCSVELLAALGRHALHIDAFARCQRLFLLFGEQHALYFVGDADGLDRSGDRLVGQAVDTDKGGDKLARGGIDHLGHTSEVTRLLQVFPILRCELDVPVLVEVRLAADRVRDDRHRAVGFSRSDNRACIGTRIPPKSGLHSTRCDLP